MKNVPTVTLDKATSYMGPGNEAAPQGAIDRLTHRKTFIIIIHRLSTITDANQITVMEWGKIPDAGAHDELLKRRPPYA